MEYEAIAINVHHEIWFCLSEKYSILFIFPGII